MSEVELRSNEKAESEPEHAGLSGRAHDAEPCRGRRPPPGRSQRTGRGQEKRRSCDPHEGCLTHENGPFATKGRPWSMIFSTPQAMPNQTRWNSL